MGWKGKKKLGLGPPGMWTGSKTKKRGRGAKKKEEMQKNLSKGERDMKNLGSRHPG